MIIDGFKPGTMVRVMDDLVEMRKLQHGWGEWNEDMSEVIRGSIASMNEAY